jgi:hypothetical protein
MALPLVALAAANVGTGLLKGLFKNKSEKKKQQALNDATIAQANLWQKMGEDQRLGSLDAGSSMLNQVGGSAPPAFNGRIDLSGFKLDPAMLERLKQERKYDFSKTVPKAGAGMGSALLSGLFGDIQDSLAMWPKKGAPTSPGMPTGGGLYPTEYDPLQDPFSPHSPFYRG